jgi:hypothetical protein
MNNPIFGRRVGETPTLDARTIYNAAIEAGKTHAEATKIVESILQAEEEKQQEQS